MARKKKHEEHQNHEAWAIPYGDLLTLLLAFFVVMYAISSVNEGKYRVLSDSLFAAFRGTPRTMEPIQVGDKQSGSGADVKTTLVEQSMLEGQPRSLLAPIPVKTGMPTRPARDSELTAAQLQRAQALQRVADQVERAMDDLVKANLVLVRRNDFWIEVEIRTDILFPSASAQLSPSAVGVIERLGTALAPFPNSIRVEGHTDDRPIKTVAFFSNWELSAARAGSVVRVLEGRGVAPERLAVIGYGEHRPTHSNDTEEGRNANRRVVIVILATDAAMKEVPATREIPVNDAADSSATVQASAEPAASDAASTAARAPGETLAAPVAHDLAAPVRSDAASSAAGTPGETLAAPLPPAVSPEVQAAPDAPPAIPHGAPSFLAQPAR
ncbi:MAG TPA: flagellar motor protein MotD [Steroidobacteraceae bacterium]|nr:flagellar motor protein MotD [Steroidobacteraceae bacterium]